ncbi:hypothetical protein [Brevundimonas sp.]|uniref:hypothetical protein n=1 Tax=Brevundimonas sp. TaxID=1871086 RepID=UPI00289B50F6|nr:hypothetical protein [Brevundimonas sp.]
MTMLEEAARAAWSAREATFPPFTRMTWEQGTPFARQAMLNAILTEQEATE